jgi:hypothetical protein
MSGQPDALWWCFAVSFPGLFGPAILVYAVRQKDAYALIFGVLISVLSMLVRSGILLALALTDYNRPFCALGNI